MSKYKLSFANVSQRHRKMARSSKASFTIRKKCPYSEIFWSVFSPNAENTDQNNSEYGHFARSVNCSLNATHRAAKPKSTFSQDL